MQVTREAARRYVEAKLREWKYRGVRIVSVGYASKEGPHMIEVKFRTLGDRRTGCSFMVWIESGKLYGEW